MFDEQSQNPNAPKNLPTEPVDMFAGVEKDEGGMAQMPKPIPQALSAGLLKKKPDSATASTGKEEADIGKISTMPMDSGKMSSPILGKVLLFLGVVLLLGGLGYGGWKFYDSGKIKSAPVPTETVGQTQTQNQNPSTTDTSTSIPAQTNNDQILFGEAIDSDKDGLDDVREKEIGANSQNPDTDGDGLTDGDEVIIYKTSPLISDTDGDGLSDGDEVLIWRSNPLNLDTDGDSYPDGAEVKNGYSPVGPGKLFGSSSTTVSATSS